MSDEKVVEAKPALVLLPKEQAVLQGLVAAKNAVDREIDGFVTNFVAARLGIHRNRIISVDTDAGVVVLASDAPKE